MLSNTFTNTSLSLPSGLKYSLNRMNEAENYLNKAIKANDEKDYKKAVNYCNIAISRYDFLVNAHYEKGIALYEQGLFELAIEEYEQYLSKCKLNINPDIYVLLAEAYNQLGNYNEADNYMYYYDWDEKSDLYFRGLMAAGISSLGLDYGEDALHMFEKVLELEPENEQAIKGKARAMYICEDFLECINYIKDKMKLIAMDRNLWSCMGDAYFAINELDQAIDCYKKALKLPLDDEEFTDSRLNCYISLVYCVKQKYNLAQLYLDRVDDDWTFMSYLLQNLIDEGKKPEAEKVGKFVEDNYLYSRDVENFSSKVLAFKARNTDLSNEEVASFISSIRKDLDKFTNIIYGEDYRSYVENEIPNDIYYEKMENSIEYIDIDLFLYSTAVKYRNYISSIEEPEEKTLIVDLRGNGGGLISSAVDMADVMLPQCTSSYLVERDGTIIESQSDEQMVVFKHIVLLVDENTASSAELYALSLSKFLNNVTIMGKTTYGKGVGQTVYEDKNEGYVIYLVSFYWNVLDENIDKIGIKPDIEVDGTDLQEYINIIENHVRVSP